MSASIPLPGQHWATAADNSVSAADPAAIHTDVDALLRQLSARDISGDGTVDGTKLERDAYLLDRAHEVLVQALSTVDKN